MDVALRLDALSASKGAFEMQPGDVLKSGDRIQQTLHTTTFSPEQGGATKSAPDYRNELTTGQTDNGRAAPDTSTSKGEGVSPQ